MSFHSLTHLTATVVLLTALTNLAVAEEDISPSASQAYFFKLMQSGQSFQLSEDEAANYLRGVWRLDRKAHIGKAHYTRADRGDDVSLICTKNQLVLVDFNHAKADLNDFQAELSALKKADQGGWTFGTGSRFIPLADDHLAVAAYDYIVVLKRASGTPKFRAQDNGAKQPEDQDRAAVEDKKPATSLHVVSVDGRKGYIDSSGKIRIAPQFQNAFGFSDGLAAVQIEGRWGFIDPTGKLVIPTKFISVAPFSDGLAAVRQSNHSDPWKYIDPTGAVKIHTGFDVTSAFQNGIARVGMEDRSGLNVVKAVLTDTGPDVDYFYINKSGKTVSKPSPEHYSTGTPNELIPFQNGKLFGYVNSDGRVALEPQFAFAGRFVDGRAVALKVDQQLYGYINTAGQFVIPPQFTYANDFASGRAAVCFGEQKGWGFIDQVGKTLMAPRFSWVYGGFVDGIAQVAVDGQMGYVDPSGQWIWKPTK